jgi:hypothetical protein
MGKDRKGNLVRELPLAVYISDGNSSSTYNLNIQIYELSNRQLIAHYICEKLSSGKNINIKGEVYLSNLGRSKLKVKVRKDLTMRLVEVKRKNRGY